MKCNPEIRCFCENMRNLRAQYRLTQKEMAAMLHIGVGTLRNVERGNVPPRLSCEVFYALYRVFRVRPDEMFSSGAAGKAPLNLFQKNEKNG